MMPNAMTWCLGILLGSILSLGEMSFAEPCGDLSIERLEEQIIENGFFESSEYFDHLKSHPSKVAELLDHLYGPYKIKPLVKRISSELGEPYVVLLLEPGVANRVEKLIDFAKPALEAEAKMTPWNLRQGFAASLGTRKVYRGMMLKKSQHRDILKHGLRSKGIQTKDNQIAGLIDPKIAAHGSNISDHITNRLSDYHPELKGRDLIFSVTDHREIAESVAYHDAGFRGRFGKKLYVFELDIPEIYLLKYEGIFPQANFFAPLKVTIDNFTANQKTDIGVEMFVPYMLPAEYIKGSALIDKKPSRYKREM